MATYTEKSFGYVATNAVADAYAPTANGGAALGLLMATNKTATTITATVYYYSNATTTSYEIAANQSIPAYSTVGLIDGGLTLGAGDKVRAFASVANALVLVGSAVEKVLP